MPLHAPGVAWASQLGTMQGHMSLRSHSWLLLKFWLAGRKLHPRLSRL